MATFTRQSAVCLAGLMTALILPLSAQQAPKDLKATVESPTRVKLTWTPGTNAKAHKVLRALGSDPMHTIKSLGASDASYTDASAPTAPNVVYRIVAMYNGGSDARTPKVTVSTAGAGSTASGTPASPATVPSSPVAATPVPQPTLVPLSTAQLAPARLAPAAAAPAAAPVSGKYRVVANGFSVVKQGHSHHDDVYGGFITLHYDRQTGQLKNQDARRTKVLGDINGRVFGETDGGDFKRLRAGTASPTGGLKDGDSYPNAANARIRGPQSAPPNRETFPFEVWTGDLTNNSDAVIILPTLWSRDGKTEPISHWENAEVAAASQIWWDPAVQEALRHTSLGVVAPPSSTTPNANSQWRALERLGAAFLGQSWALATFDPSTRDRAIGLDSTARGLPRRAIVLTREMVEQALNGPKPLLLPTMLVPHYPAWMLPYLDVPVGVIPVLLSDYVPPPGEPLKWTYVMYLQVERM